MSIVIQSFPLTINFQFNSRRRAGRVFHTCSLRSQTQHPRNIASQTAPPFVLPASDKTPSLSCPSSGKARLPGKAAPWLETGPAAPHGTWETRPVVSAENLAGKGRRHSESRTTERQLRDSAGGSRRAGLRSSRSGRGSGGGAGARTARSEPRRQVLQILIKARAGKVQQRTGQPWVGSSTATTSKAPSREIPTFRVPATWSRTWAVQSPFGVSAFPKRTF